jgi:hypothetical protein
MFVLCGDRTYDLLSSNRVFRPFSIYIPERVGEASQAEAPTFYQNYLVMKNTADVKGSLAPSDRSLFQMRVILYSRRLQHP